MSDSWTDKLNDIATALKQLGNMNSDIEYGFTSSDHSIQFNFYIDSDFYRISPDKDDSSRTYKVNSINLFKDKLINKLNLPKDVLIDYDYSKIEFVFENEDDVDKYEYIIFDTIKSIEHNGETIVDSNGRSGRYSGLSVSRNSVSVLIRARFNVFIR